MSERVATRAASAPPARAPASAVGWTLVAATVLAGLWLAAPPMGTDLSAQVARADFFAGYGWALIDFRWYGGVMPHGYSLLSPPLMAWFGPRPVGAGALVLSSVAFVLLLLRTGAPRPLLGGLLGAVCFAGNLVSGRVTFALGVALALLALRYTASIMDFSRRVAGVSSYKVHDRLGRRVASLAWLASVTPLAAAVALAALATAASPVAGLFVALAGTAMVLADLGRSPHLPSFTERGQRGTPRRPRSVKEGSGSGALGTRAGGLALVVGAAAPMVVMAGLFGSGGWMNMSRADLASAALASLAVAVLVPHRVVRVGAVLSAAGVVAAYLLPTAVGLNATRLASMFALPLVAAYATVPGWLRRPAWLPGWLRREVQLPAGRGRSGRVPDWLGLLGRLRRRPALWLVPVLAGLVAWQPPVVYQDLAAAGDPAASPEFFAALQEELVSHRLTGRVEVVPTVHYWEAAYVDTPPLARGWLRQADTGRNPLFFDGTLEAGTYRSWLADNGVSYVALPRAPVSWVGGREAELIERGLPYLAELWRDDNWILYEVDGAPALVEGPAALQDYAPDAVTMEVTEPGEVLLRVRWSRWLTVSGPGEPCVAPAGEWTAIRVTEPGEYELTGALLSPGPRC